MDNFDFDAAYDSMTTGQKQHMTNRIYKYDGLVPQGLKQEAREPTFTPGQRFTDANGRAWLLCYAGYADLSKMGLINLQTGYLYAIPRASSKAGRATLDDLKAMGPAALWVDSPAGEGTMARRVY